MLLYLRSFNSSGLKNTAYLKVMIQNGSLVPLSSLEKVHVSKMVHAELEKARKITHNNKLKEETIC